MVFGASQKITYAPQNRTWNTIFWLNSCTLCTISISLNQFYQEKHRLFPPSSGYGGTEIRSKIRKITQIGTKQQKNHAIACIVTEKYHVAPI